MRGGEGGLRERLVERSAHAHRHGALSPIESESHRLEEDGLQFQVRVASAPSSKPPVHPTSRRPNPFLPYEEDLFVGDLSETHLGLLNKFPVVAHHLLIVTRVFEEQTTPLSLGDFEALWRCLAEIDGLVFYNSGRAAGASQAHRHLQLIPERRVLGEGPDSVLLLYDEAAERSSGSSVERLPFVHALTATRDLVEVGCGDAARESLERYRVLLRAVGDDRAARPYNLLATRGWMLLVPRSRESHGGVEVNGLAYAGAFFARGAEQLEALRDRGPLAFLCGAGVRR